MGIIWAVIVGFIVGALARFIKPGNDSMGFIMTSLLGVIGAFVAGVLGKLLGLYAPDEAAGFLASVIGALILLFVAEYFRKK